MFSFTAILNGKWHFVCSVCQFRIIFDWTVFGNVKIAHWIWKERAYKKNSELMMNWWRDNTFSLVLWFLFIAFIYYVLFDVLNNSQFFFSLFLSFHQIHQTVINDSLLLITIQISFIFTRCSHTLFRWLRNPEAKSKQSTFL